MRLRGKLEIERLKVFEQRVQCANYKEINRGEQ